MTTSRLFHKDSPLIPKIDIPDTVANIRRDLALHYELISAIGNNIATLMTTHIELLRQDSDVLAKNNFSVKNLKDVTYGFNYVVATILASAICKKKATRAERLALYEELIAPTHNFTNLRIQEQIAVDLFATCNLLNIDPSGALVFQYLKDYPFSTEEFFLTGMEIATHLFAGLFLILTKDLGEQFWADIAYDPTLT